uniref:Erythrocyte membrane glycopeptide n=1 Tax=Homo sapiens TaxID=9606 RepID=GLEM_HUMAN|nr:RecName: Full=Erythrocyte membrane glycopeptide [Homo sapiens]prf//711078A peptide,glyco [Homo sapiens]
CEGHSHDHGA